MYSRSAVYADSIWNDDWRVDTTCATGIRTTARGNPGHLQRTRSPGEYKERPQGGDRRLSAESLTRLVAAAASLCCAAAAAKSRADTDGSRCTALWLKHSRSQFEPNCTAAKSSLYGTTRRLKAATVNLSCTATKVKRIPRTAVRGILLLTTLQLF